MKMQHRTMQNVIRNTISIVEKNQIDIIFITPPIQTRHATKDIHVLIGATPAPGAEVRPTPAPEAEVKKKNRTSAIAAKTFSDTNFI